jgi:uncharacterized protein (DUF362 family)
MKHRRSHRTRREFIRQSCTAAAGLGLAPLFAACSNTPKLPETAGEPEQTKSHNPVLANGPRVISRVDPKVFGTDGHDAKRIRALVDEAVTSLVGVADPSEAFRALFEPDDVVAIKVNCLAGPGMSSSPAVVAALVAGLRSIGVQHDQIYIWERSTEELRKAGFEPNRYSDKRPRCLGNDEGGWMSEIEFSGEVGSLWSSILAKRATALINVPVLKDHDLSGVGCGMKNMYGAIHNPNRYHEDNCDPFVADVSAHPHVKDKLKLVLCDALTAQYHGGPARVLQHQWRPGQVLASADPVALDRVAQQLIEEQRKAKGMSSLTESGRPPKWLKTAADKYELGEADLSKIELNEG